LPDRSVTEVLQRVVGVTIGHLLSSADPEHYSVEGSGVAIRGLTYVRAELNGRDSFSANGGRSLNFEDVTPELMAGVDVYKNPSAEQIEGGIGGLVNLRTAMPFDFTGQKFSISLSTAYSTLRKAASPKVSALYSNRWDLGSAGQFGALIDLAHSTRPRPAPTRSRSTRTSTSPPAAPRSGCPRARRGAGSISPTSATASTSRCSGRRTTSHPRWTYFKSRYNQEWDENAIFTQASTPYNLHRRPRRDLHGQGGSEGHRLRDDADGGLNSAWTPALASRKSDTQGHLLELQLEGSDAGTSTPT